MDASDNIDRENDNTNDDNADVVYAAAVSVTTGLSSINTSISAPDMSDDKLVALQLKDKNENSDFNPCLKLPKSKVNKNNFEECMKSSKSIAPIPSGSIEHMFCDKGPPEGTVTHQFL